MQASDIVEIGLNAGFSKDQVSAALRSLDDAEVERLAWMVRWVEKRHEFQVVPEGQWSNWLALAGRGSGKTRLGAEWMGMNSAMAKAGDRGLVVAPTKADLRDVCFEGDSGLVRTIPSSLVKYYHKSPSPQIMLHNGAMIGGIAAASFERTRGPQWCRAWCLLGETLVYMSDGTERRLDCVKAGDYVMTRNGARRVEWAGMTNPAAEVCEVSTDYGSTIYGTMDHPIWTQEESFVCLSNLTPHHHVMCLPTAGAGSNVQTATTTGATELGLVAKIAKRPSTFTSQFLRKRLVRFPMGLLSTIATKTKATTYRLISKLCRGLSIIAFTHWVGPLPKFNAQRLDYCVSSNGVTLSMCDANALNAEWSLSRAHKVSLESPAAPPAWNAAEAATLSAVSSVRTLPGRHAVYNLKVQGQPEFFANGILVHNCDEVAAWGEDGKIDPEEVWDTMVFSVRLGDDTRILATTTPKPKPLIKMLVKDPDTVITTATTMVNLDNLSPEFARRILKYQGTKIGRQEIYAELIDAEEGGIISRSWLRLWPSDKPLPMFHYIVASLDTAFSEEAYDKKKQTTDPSAMSVWGCFKLPNGKPGVMLLDCWAERLGLPDLVKKVINETDRTKIRYGQSDKRPMIMPFKGPKATMDVGRPIDLIVIEGKASGKSLRQVLAKEGIFTQEYNPGNADKLTRGHVVSPIAKDGIIWIPESTSRPGKPMTWAEPLVEQVCSYSGPGSVIHDDLYDTFTQALRVIDWQWLHYLEVSEAQKKKIGPDTISRSSRRSQNPYAA